MGLDLSYQSFPPDCGLIELARADVEDGWALGLLPGRLAREEFAVGPNRDNRIFTAFRKLAAAMPDLSHRYCELDRTWDVLHYLLSATRRDEPARWTDLIMDRAFKAGETIAEHVAGGQGVPIRYIAPPYVAEIADIVERLDERGLASHYDPVRMEREGVYKFWASRADDVMWETILHYFFRLQKFFVNAKAAGDAVIVCMD